VSSTGPSKFKTKRHSGIIILASLVIHREIREIPIGQGYMPTIAERSSQIMIFLGYFEAKISGP
jgi:hypothetical protein